MALLQQFCSIDTAIKQLSHCWQELHELLASLLKSLWSSQALHILYCTLGLRVSTSCDMVWVSAALGLTMLVPEALLLSTA